MKATHIIRRFDESGKFIFPKRAREMLMEDIVNKPFEIFYESDGTIILKPVKIDEEYHHITDKI